MTEAERKYADHRARCAAAEWRGRLLAAALGNDVSVTVEDRLAGHTTLVRVKAPATAREAVREIASLFGVR